jgi:signal transduction histidine kinase
VGVALFKNVGVALHKRECLLRFLPDIRYGTENYPENVARRLRALNLTAWCAAAIAAFCFASYVALEFLDPRPGLWKAGVVYALAASIWASVPLLHRFGTLWGPLILILTANAYFFAITCLFGTGIGLQMCYLTAGAITAVILGTEHILLSAVLGVLAVLQIVVLQIMVPYSTGLFDSGTLLANFAFTVTVTMATLIAIGVLTLREAERAEANLEEKSRQLEMADRYKSHFLASASHDLRQPLHALNLFGAQLPTEKKPAERKRLVSRIDASVASMNELFEALLDMTKLEAGTCRQIRPSLRSSGCSTASKRHSPHQQKRRASACASSDAARGYAAIRSCLSVSCSIWWATRCATQRAAVSWLVAAAVPRSCASTFAIPAPAFLRISARAYSASSTSWRPLPRIARRASDSALPSLIGLAACSATRCNCSPIPVAVRVSRFWSRWRPNSETQCSYRRRCRLPTSRGASG